MEGQVAAGQAAHLAGEVQQVPAGVGDHVLPGHGEQRIDLGQVAEHALGAQLLHDRVEERLLAVRAVQVAVGQAVTLADEGQRHRGGQVLVAALWTWEPELGS